MNTFELKESLGKGICAVTFTKLNGDKRVMRCTTSSGIIPEDKLPKVLNEDTTPAKVNLDVQKVYDVVAEGWRSFRYDSVTNVEV